MRSLVLAAVLAVTVAGVADAARCRDNHGQPIHCPTKPPSQPLTVCHDPQGRLIRCP